MIYSTYMDADQFKSNERIESGEFHRDLHTIAEKVRTETKELPAEQRPTAEMESIRRHLRENHETGSEELSRPDTQKANGHLNDADREDREHIAQLVSQAVNDGIPAAAAEAQKHNDPYLIDAFHDELTHFMHQKMRDNNLI